MTSRWAGAAGAAAAALLAASCGSSVHDLGVPTTPLVVLHGHVDISLLDRPHPDAPLLGALIWAAVPGVNPVCVEAADQRLTANDPTLAQQVTDACPDPRGVFPGPAEVWAPLAADGSFDLTLYALPPAGVSVGDGLTRITYGSLVVVEDVNGDGQPTLPRPPTGERRRSVGSQPSDPDRIVAATFHHLDSDQERVVFREGGFVKPSFFYPLPDADGCVPDEGFSLMTVRPLADPGMAPCSFSSADTRVEVPPLSDPFALELLCRGVQTDALVRQPVDDEGPSPAATKVCFGANVMAAVYHPGRCPVLRSYALAGCQQDPLCAAPEWNVPVSLISWWSCP